MSLTLLPTEILSHTNIVLAATQKPLKLWLPNFVTSCFYLFPQFEKIFAKSIGQGGGGGGGGAATVIFQTRAHEKLEA